MLEILRFGHPLIALAYFLIGFLFLFIRLPTERRTWAARIGAALFFYGCGFHHLEFIVHIQEGSPIDADSIHHSVATLMQLIGAPTFIIAAGPYLKGMVETIVNPDRLERLDR